MKSKRIYRTEGSDAKLFGVCGGFAEYWGIDPSLVRVGCVVLALCGAAGIYGYIICALVFPKKSEL